MVLWIGARKDPWWNCVDAPFTFILEHAPNLFATLEGLVIDFPLRLGQYKLGWRHLLIARLRHNEVRCAWIILRDTVQIAYFPAVLYVRLCMATFATDPCNCVYPVAIGCI